MKKIISGVGMIVFAAAIVASGTGAFFSDTETSTGNVFTAGEIDLKIDNSSYGFDWNRPGVEAPTGVWGPNAANSWSLRDLDACLNGEATTTCLFFNFLDLKPGDYGEDTISLHVQNDAWACAAFTLTGTPDNGINDPEGDAGDVTDGVSGGELQNYLEFVFWNDDGDNVLETGEQVIQSLSGLAKDIFTGTKLAIADSSTGEPLPAGVTSYIGKGWCFGDLVTAPVAPAANPNGPTPGNTGFTCSGVGNHNVAQTDGINVDVTFDAVQARHNDNFLCTPSTEPVVTRLTLEKVILQDAEAPVTESLWTLTASGTTAGTGVISGVESDLAVTAAIVTAGSYDLSESVVSGFTQTGLVCGGTGVTLVGSTVTIPAGSNAVCTFQNTENTLL